MSKKNQLKKSIPQEPQNKEPEQKKANEEISIINGKHVALIQIMHNGRLFKVGDVVQGLSPAQTQLLINNKSIEAQ